MSIYPKFYLSHSILGEKEVTKAEFVAEERRQGFRSTYGKDDEPATGGFGSYRGGIRGRIEYRSPNDAAWPHPDGFAGGLIGPQE